jgi:hypothetical protein
MNPLIVSILNKNTRKIQRQFYEKIKCKPSVADHMGYVYGVSKTSDIHDVSNNWVKLGRTERDPNIRAAELKCDLDFYCKTNYNKKCERLIHLLFNCYSVHRMSENKNKKEIEWFNITDDINVNKVMVIIAEYVDKDSNKDLPKDNEEHKIWELPKELENEPLVLNDSMMDEDKYDDNDMEIALGCIAGVVIGGILVSAFSYILSDKDENCSDIKTGLSGDIMKIVKLYDNEVSLYYYTKGKIHIILTNMRFLKVENNNIISESYLSNIQYINHIKNGVFHYDKIEIIEKTSRIETYGIYSKNVCKDFIKILNKIISENVKPPLYDSIG